jgi:hypothetical protein
LEVPARVVAGQTVTLRTSGQGKAAFYLLGPGTVSKRTVKLGEDISLAPESVQGAGRYLAILRSGEGNVARGFWVVSADPAAMSFLARPSRLPVALPDAISGVVYLFDAYGNLVMQPREVKFELSVAGAPAETRTVRTSNGVAWTRAGSGSREGPAQFTASSAGVMEKRVVQLVASDPCNLRMEAARGKQGIEVRTAPVRDCAGNPVPDGTIVTFTAITSRGKSTVDARIKRGEAVTTFPLQEPALLSVASGVVLGNEVRIGGGR